ncbi:class I SAM-dependent methyltransferase [Streptomyces sp. HSW2009]|uniref:class I SAM-dependent methyltransferase n=1 Tax=Streptomyces sp. HSW2009 TaxID=3142890 RepID=UPI0032EC96BC
MTTHHRTTHHRTNRAAIDQWNTYPRAAMEAMEPEGDFAKRHLLNPVLFRLLGDVRGRRVLDAGCGQGYFSRLLADRGAHVTAVEPARALLDYAREKEAERRQGIRYVHAELGQPLAMEGEFDAVVCSMVLGTVPDWKPALRSCVRALRPGGLLVISLNHPAFEQLLSTWRTHGAYRIHRYLEEYEIPQTHAPDYHRPLSTYLNELAGLGCRLRELAEPGLSAAAARDAEPTTPGIESYTQLPNFAVIAASLE